MTNVLKDREGEETETLGGDHVIAGGGWCRDWGDARMSQERLETRELEEAGRILPGVSEGAGPADTLI